MSLSDLEKRAVLKPVEAELDRQKEKAGKFKKERNRARKALGDIKSLLMPIHLERVSPEALSRVVDALKEIGDEEKSR